MTLGRADIEALVPHKHAMCLWDEVLDWDAQRIVLRTAGHRDAAHPLRSDGQLRALHLCEYAAQAMAVHGGLLAMAPGAMPRPGILVALRDVVLHVERLDDLPGLLECEATQLAAGEDSQLYAFRIVHQGALVGSGRATVMLGGDGSAG
ncbi:phosphotransferase [uncultured Luteimonas sp.]|uniref:phosphotransferase n=1 Tax=uncultured Luteimonas sp. TaxID=453144 RepID=UPI002604E9B0|nr:phosphotransferase [uncultured Luteimonas sp.]